MDESVWMLETILKIKEIKQNNKCFSLALFVYIYLIFATELKK